MRRGETRHVRNEAAILAAASDDEDNLLSLAKGLFFRDPVFRR